MGPLNRLKLFKELIKFVVRDGRIVLDIVAPVVLPNLRTELFIVRAVHE
jgi:hypothetical protein